MTLGLRGFVHLILVGALLPVPGIFLNPIMTWEGVPIPTPQWN